jgi:hypothetical protein
MLFEEKRLCFYCDCNIIIFFYKMAAETEKLDNHSFKTYDKSSVRKNSLNNKFNGCVL